MHYSFSFVCPIELLNVYHQTCIIMLRMNTNVDSFHDVIQSSVTNMHPRIWKTDTSLKKDIMKKLVRSLFYENACGKDANGGNTRPCSKHSSLCFCMQTLSTTRIAQPWE